MSNTANANATFPTRRGLLGLAALVGTDAAFAQPSGNAQRTTGTASMTATSTAPLTRTKLALGPIAAATAVGDMTALPKALNAGLDAGLTIGDAKEVLVQLYAYAGFPRSLNALTELMKVVEDRRSRGIQDAPGVSPQQPVPMGQALLEIGTANQTKLSGAPVRGPLFDFAPAIDQYLKTHLFGDIFARDNLDWQSREFATVGALSALSGVESQLLSHVRISINVGITPEQLRQFSQELTAQGFVEAGGRVRVAVAKYEQDAAKK
jgi:alkylhydroperoxidase/carboxymuconolactone decarboxylase family protein YurZ